MLGAIAGDIIGSAYEFHYTKNPNFDLFLPSSRFTDDTVLTVAVADCILKGKEYAPTIKEYGKRYPNAGYGGSNCLHFASTVTHCVILSELQKVFDRIMALRIVSNFLMHATKATFLTLPAFNRRW